MTSLIPAPQLPAQADTDTQLIKLWLHGRGPNTRDAYSRDVARLQAHVGKPLASVTLADFQCFVDALTGSIGTQRRTIAALKSLFGFGQRVGYLQFNVSAAVRAPRQMDTLAERILPEAAIHRMIALADGRNRMLLRLLYATGGRVSEVCALKWRHAQESGDAGQITLYGKGGKTHAILLSAALWADLAAYRTDAPDDAPVFLSRKGGHLDRSQALRIVQQAARTAGIAAKVSPHWFRHAHASHAMDRGAGVHLVRETLGHSSIAVTGRYLHAKPTESSAKYLAV